ncbi:MAG: thrombospondin type 3 repeat-containing protein [Deltaproteobacteria bacterium]|nr:thrombospondin type 3 repeat-containing protein [Deltaproteobacteria bacterium]
MTAGHEHERGGVDGKMPEHAESLTRKLAAIMACALCGCAASDTRAPIDPNDLDGDGIPNDADLCPERYDPDQHDEDGDGIGDLCDNCPTIPNPDQADTSEVALLQFEDGVGDACDLRPARAGDVLAFFHPFASAGEAAAFTGEGWTIANDHAVAGGTARWAGKRRRMGDGLMGQLHLPVISWLDGQAGGASVALELDVDEGSGLTCAIRRAATVDGADELVASEVFGETAVKRIGVPGIPVTNAILVGWRDINFDRKATFLCRAIVGGIGGTVHEIRIPSGLDLGFGSYAFGASGAHVEASALLVYTSPMNHGNL